MKRFSPLLALAVAGTLIVSSAHASGRSGDLGGGLIEFLFTGGGERVERSPRLTAPTATGHRQTLNAPVRQVLAAVAAPTRPPVDPRFDRQFVDYAGSERPGTIVVDTSERFLFLVLAGGKALRYGVGVGRPGFEWAGRKTITRKAEWPDWRPPAEMLQRRPDLPTFMAGGPKNPLGARALYLGSSLYRIHGSNEPHTIGQAVSSGCIRMRNEDVVDLYDRVSVGTAVLVR